MREEAGNVSALVTTTVVIDGTSPEVTIEAVESSCWGTASDGSGVESVQISLDGGVSYQDVTYDGVGWTFDYSDWFGGPSIEVIIIRAIDIYGNVTQLAISIAAGPIQLYLPIVLK